MDQCGERVQGPGRGRCWLHLGVRMVMVMMTVMVIVVIVMMTTVMVIVVMRGQ